MRKNPILITVLLAAGCFEDPGPDSPENSATSTEETSTDEPSTSPGSSDENSTATDTTPDDTSEPTSPNETTESESSEGTNEPPSCFEEDWESPDIERWTTGGDFGTWSRTTFYAFAGTWSVTSPIVNAEGRAWINTTVNVPENSVLRFSYLNDVGPGTRLVVMIDGEQAASYSAFGSWVSDELPFPAGVHAVEFAVERDSGGTDAGYQKAWVDEITICP